MLIHLIGFVDCIFFVGLYGRFAAETKLLFWIGYSCGVVRKILFILFMFGFYLWLYCGHGLNSN